MINFSEKKYFGNNSENGFTLVEIIVASLLLAIITVGIFSVTLSSRKVISITHRRNFATVVAQTALENLRVYLDGVQWYNTSSPIYPSPWQCHNLNDLADTFLNMSSIFGTSDFAMRYSGRWCYKIEIVSDPTCPSGTCDYRKATVEVNWAEP